MTQPPQPPDPEQTRTQRALSKKLPKVYRNLTKATDGLMVVSNRWSVLEQKATDLSNRLTERPPAPEFDGAAARADWHYLTPEEQADYQQYRERLNPPSLIDTWHTVRDTFANPGYLVYLPVVGPLLKAGPDIAAVMDEAEGTLSNAFRDIEAAHEPLTRMLAESKGVLFPLQQQLSPEERASLTGESAVIPGAIQVSLGTITRAAMEAAHGVAKTLSENLVGPDKAAESVSSYLAGVDGITRGLAGATGNFAAALQDPGVIGTFLPRDKLEVISSGIGDLQLTLAQLASQVAYDRADLPERVRIGIQGIHEGSTTLLGLTTPDRITAMESAAGAAQRVGHAVGQLPAAPPGPAAAGQEVGVPRLDQMSSAVLTTVRTTTHTAATGIREVENSIKNYRSLVIQATKQLAQVTADFGEGAQEGARNAAARIESSSYLDPTAMVDRVLQTPKQLAKMGQKATQAGQTLNGYVERMEEHQRLSPQPLLKLAQSAEKISKASDKLESVAQSIRLDQIDKALRFTGVLPPLRLGVDASLLPNSAVAQGRAPQALPPLWATTELRASIRTPAPAPAAPRPPAPPRQFPPPDGPAGPAGPAQRPPTA